jgi:hypothetical protein
MAAPSDAEQTQILDRFFRAIEKQLTWMNESLHYAEDRHVRESGRARKSSLSM